MSFCTAMEYAARAAVYLAKTRGVVSSSEIAEQTKVPRDYLIRILRKGAAAGIFTAYQGVNGGYCLKREPGQVSLYDLMEITQGPLMLFQGPEKPSASPYGQDPYRAMCGRLQQIIEDYLKSHAVSDLLNSEGNDGADV